MDHLAMECPLHVRRFLPSITGEVNKMNGHHQQCMTLSHLKEIEKHTSISYSCFSYPPKKDLVLKGPLEGSTPLLFACHHGQLESVKHIVESWGADVRATAVYYQPLLDQDSKPSESITVVEVTPLFVAAFRGHLEVVRYLLEKGADIHAKTCTNGQNLPDVSSFKCYKYTCILPKFDGLTPLHGALSLFRGRSPSSSDELLDIPEERRAIVRLLLDSGADPSALSSDGSPIWMMPLCGLDVLASLLDHGMKWNLRNQTGKTAMHHWTSLRFRDRIRGESTALDTVKLLLERGSDLNAQDDEGFTPILTAACDKGQHPPNFTVLDFLLDREDVDRKQKIDALELAGAAEFLCLYRTIPIFVYRMQAFVVPVPIPLRSLGCWHRATELRLETDDSDPYCKTPLERLSGGTIEWTTIDQLEDLKQHPLKCLIQSFFVKLRIISSLNCGAVGPLLRTFRNLNEEFCYKLKRELRFTELLDCFWALFETMLQCRARGSKLWMELASYEVNYFIETLSVIQPTDYYLTRDKIIANEAVTTSLRLLLAVKESYSIGLSLMSSKKLIGLVSSISYQTQMMEDQDLLESLTQLISGSTSDPLEKTDILTLACATINPYPRPHSNTFFLYHTVRFLLHCGANPNLQDEKGDAPLHALVKTQSNQPWKLDVVDCTARLLLEYDANLNQVNADGKTAVDLWIQENGRKRHLNGERAAEWSDLPDWCRPDTVPTLKRLSAYAIRSYNINYSRLPPSLHSYVDKR